MATVYEYEPTFDIRGWFDPTLTGSGWFDSDWSETAGSPPPPARIVDRRVQVIGSGVARHRVLPIQVAQLSAARRTVVVAPPDRVVDRRVQVVAVGQRPVKVEGQSRFRVASREALDLRDVDRRIQVVARASRVQHSLPSAVTLRPWQYVVAAAPQERWVDRRVSQVDIGQRPVAVEGQVKFRVAFREALDLRVVDRRVSQVARAARVTHPLVQAWWLRPQRTPPPVAPDRAMSRIQIVPHGARPSRPGQVAWVSRPAREPLVPRAVSRAVPVVARASRVQHSLVFVRPLSSSNRTVLLRAPAPTRFVSVLRSARHPNRPSFAAYRTVPRVPPPPQFPGFARGVVAVAGAEGVVTSLGAAVGAVSDPSATTGVLVLAGAAGSVTLNGDASSVILNLP